MTETSGADVKPPRNQILFCEKPWKVPAVILVCLVVLTFAWGFYILGTYDEVGYYEDADGHSVTDFLFREIATPDVQRLYDVVSPAVVGISGRGVNASVIGSGAIVSAGGYVLTTLHTVNGLAEIDVHVRTAGGVKRYEALVVKSHPPHDLVLLKMLTSERFVFFVIGDPGGGAVGSRVFSFGQGVGGNTVVKPGTVLGSNVKLTASGKSISHLLKTDAVYAWEQNGGPLVNARGELVAIALALQGTSGTVDGYAVPAQVIVAHFQDVVNFKIAAADGGGNAAGPAQAVQAAASGPSQAGGAGSAAWWTKARARVARDKQTLGYNVAMGTAAGAAAAAAPMAAVDNEHLLSGRIAGYPLGDIIGLVLLALVAGITGGMMTMGGGVLQVAGMMVIFGYGMYLIRPVAYLTNICVYGAAALRNNAAGLIMWDKVRALVPWAVGGIVAGYFIGNAIGDDAVAFLLGVFALLMAAKGLHEIFADHPEEILVRTGLGNPGNPGNPGNTGNSGDALDDLLEGGMGADRPEALREHMKSAGMGLPMGLVSGILGISGGVVEVPLQRFFGGLSLRNAIANSSVLVFWASVTGALVAFVHGIYSGLIEWHAPLTLALIMIPGAYVGGIIGAKLMKILPAVVLKCFYTAIMAAISVKMLFIG